MNVTHRAVTVLTVAAATLAAASVAAGGTIGAAATPESAAAGTAATARPVAAVPAGFQPASASFRSPERGVVLGGVKCAHGVPCRARVVATRDGGAHWRFLNAPGVWLASHRHLVSQVVFASGRNGWLFNQGGGRKLWATHDGGSHWRKLTMPGTVMSLAASGGTVYAVVARHFSKPWKLFRSPASRDAWTRAGHMTGGRAVLAVWGHAAWFGDSTHLWVTADGKRWHQHPFRCPQRYSAQGLASIAAASPTRVVFLCLGNAAAGSQGKAVLRSADGGKTTHRAGIAPFGGSGGVLAVPPHHSKLIGLGATFVLYRSQDRGKTWAQVFFQSGGASWNYLAFPSQTVGWAEFGSPGELLHSTDAGLTWQQVKF